TTSFVPGIAGCDISLTIDANIQKVLEDVADRALLEQQAKGVTAIIMNPNNGEIVSMVSKPSFDLNNPPRDDVEKLLAYSKNVNIVDVYEPGSTFKLFTISAALNEGITNIEEKFFDPGYRVVDGEKIKCWRTKGHGSQTLAEGLANSCNSVFMDLGLRLGKDKLYEYLKRFGIGTATGVDFYGESSGIMMNIDNVKNVDLARIAFGQAVAVTPLQMITSVCAVLNGTLYKPHFVKSITSADGTVKQFDAVPVRKVLDKTISNQVAQLMEGVVSTKGLYSFVPGYRIGGKTGTAQKYEDGHVANGKYVSSFVGCYPVENPEYVLLLCVDEPSTGVYYGSLVAAPYAKQVFSGIFTYKNIAPTNLTEDLEKLKPTIDVPNLIGLSITEAVGLLKKMKLEYELDGDGDFVTWQHIPAGEKVFAGAIIMIKT
ncbi:MAG: PASTA domain-containing protein, partial [Clostridia bacterium]|nr:PASTA domain-containing protein [Clostridia bacterium]